jgi:hypothetical protein
MTTQSDKRAKAEQAAAHTQAKYLTARLAYAAAHSAWLARTDYATAAYSLARYELKPLEAERNKWFGQWAKAMERLASAE